MTREFPQLEQDLVFPPGETLLETIEHLGMTQKELAARTGVSTKHINHLVKGKAPISPQMAISLESATGVPAGLWMNLEKTYQEYRARAQEREALREQVPSLRLFNVKEMAQYGWIAGGDDKVSVVKQVLMFLGVSHLDYWETVADTYATHYRKSEAFDCNKVSLTLWLRQGERQTAAIECKPYHADAFRNALQAVRGMTARLPDDFVHQISHLCSLAGVAVAFVPELKGSRVSGATRWLNPTKASVLLSARHRADDHLWFTFFHEAGHILLHGNREAFLDLENGGDSPTEEEANAFAADFLIPHGEYARFVKDHTLHFSTAAVQRFAKHLGIAPGIIVGRLQHDGCLPYTHLNVLKRRFRWGQHGTQK
ncbi:MAG: HigA family addiction module antidote protein [Peptococcaceae bacterium]|nr:HigA family addiction module antidote protein [Peptococcaceae bacterium]